MPLPPQKFREAVFQILFTSDFAPDADEMVGFMMGELKTTRREMSEACARVNKILEKQIEIDEMISAYSTEYSIDRISKVELTILRLGLYEILFDDNVPSKVAIAEAIRLTRKFGTNESAQYINAILDAVYKKHAPASEEPVLV